MTEEQIEIVEEGLLSPTWFRIVHSTFQRQSKRKSDFEKLNARIDELARLYTDLDERYNQLRHPHHKDKS